MPALQPAHASQTVGQARGRLRLVGRIALDRSQRALQSDALRIRREG